MTESLAEPPISWYDNLLTLPTVAFNGAREGEDPATTEARNALATADLSEKQKIVLNLYDSMLAMVEHFFAAAGCRHVEDEPLLPVVMGLHSNAPLVLSAQRIGQLVATEGLRTFRSLIGTEPNAAIRRTVASTSVQIEGWRGTFNIQHTLGLGDFDYM